MAFGVTAQGFKKKRLSDIKIEIENSLRSTLGNNINLLPESVLANLTGIFSERESSLWELAEATYQSRDVDAATGVNLDNTLALVNVTRLDAAKSLQSDLHLFGTAGITVPTGTQVSVLGSPASTFKTKNDVTLVAGTDEVQTVDFSAAPTSGDFRLKFRNEETVPINWNANAATIEAALNSLSKLDGVTVSGTIATILTITFAGNSGKIDQPLLEVTDNNLLNGVTALTSTVLEVTPGVAQGKVNAEANDDGAITAPGYSLTVIDTPVAGLSRVLNIEDATVGRSVEEDADYRIRSKVAQKGSGSGTVEAIRAKLLEVSGVTQAIVFENTTLVVDGNGLPAKSFRAYVQGGADQDILDKIWLAKGGGIQPDGIVTGNITDSQGIIHLMKFSRPDVIEIYITIEITTDSRFPADGEAQVRAALAAYVNSLDIGSDVIVYPALMASINNIVGIIDVEIGVDTSPAPALGTDNNIAVAINEVAKVVVPATDIGITII